MEGSDSCTLTLTLTYPWTIPSGFCKPLTFSMNTQPEPGTPQNKSLIALFTRRGGFKVALICLLMLSIRHEISWKAA